MTRPGRIHTAFLTHMQVPCFLIGSSRFLAHLLVRLCVLHMQALHCTYLFTYMVAAVMLLIWYETRCAAHAGIACMAKASTSQLVLTGSQSTARGLGSELQSSASGALAACPS